MDTSLTRADQQQSDLEKFLDCSDVRLVVESCKIDKYTKDINIMVVNQSQMDLPDFILSILGKTYDGEEFNQNILFSKKLKKGESAFLTTLEAVTILDDSNIEDLDIRKIDKISLGNQRCNNLFISDLNYEVVDSLEDNLVAYYSLDKEDLVYNKLEGSEWLNSNAYGRQTGTTYFEKNGDVITGVMSTGTWLGPSILYPANKKTKYNIKAEFNVLAGSQGKIGYHLYRDGVLVDYDVPTDSQGKFPLYHGTGLYNYGNFSLTTHKIDTIIDLSSAPDFDSINLAFLVGSPTTISSPTIVFNVNSVSINEVLVEDLSGHGNHGEIKGTTFTEDQKGDENSAMLFNGTSDYISFGKNTVLNYDEFTVLLWSKAESKTQTHVKNLIGKGNWNSWNDWYIGYKNGTDLSFVYGLYWSSGPKYPMSSFDLTNWNFFGGVADLTTQKLYLNSNLVGSVNIEHVEVNDTTYDYQIARSSYNPNLYNGTISDIMIYNKALTDKEIRAIYNESRTN